MTEWTLRNLWCTTAMDIRMYVCVYVCSYVRSVVAFLRCVCLLLCRSEAQDRITAMKEQLKSSAHSASLFEEGKHDAEMRLKDAETRRDAFKKQVRTYVHVHCL